MRRRASRAIRAPMMAANAIDDRWAPPASRDAFMPGYRNAARHTLDIDPSRVGLRSIGHMGYFKARATPLWASALDWLATSHPVPGDCRMNTHAALHRATGHRRASRASACPAGALSGRRHRHPGRLAALVAQLEVAMGCARRAPRAAFSRDRARSVRLRRQCDAGDVEILLARRRSPARRGSRRPPRFAARPRTRRRPLLRRRGGVAVRAAQPRSCCEPDAVRADGLRHARPR